MCIAPHHCAMQFRCEVRYQLKLAGIEDEIETLAKEKCPVNTAPSPPPVPEQPFTIPLLFANVPLPEPPIQVESSQPHMESE